MSAKPQTSAANTTPAASTKQTRSRKAANPDAAVAGRAGSAGGVVLEKDAPKKLSTASSAKPTTPTANEAKDAQPKRKPRKLNKEPTAAAPTATKDAPSAEAAELEALKSRVRGLEAKVEELYKSAPQSGTAPRSPRRRGKGRKSSSATTTATLGTLARDRDVQGQGQAQAQAQVTELDDQDADEELLRLEDELEHARQDLALYRPTTSSSPSTSSTQRPRPHRSPTTDSDPVEEIPRDRPATTAVDRQVTLSGSYRIPLPATLNPEDVKTIQSGVTAAQNVARSFLDQRRANSALRNAQAEAGPPPSHTGGAKQTTAAKAKAKTNAARDAGAVEVGSAGAAADAGGKQSWGEWIGGYSMAISRAVKSIEHEAAMEAQRTTTGQAGGRRSSAAAGGSAAGGTGGSRRKRPAPKTTLSGEQVEGLMG